MDKKYINTEYELDTFNRFEHTWRPDDKYTWNFLLPDAIISRTLNSPIVLSSSHRIIQVTEEPPTWGRTSCGRCGWLRR